MTSPHGNKVSLLWCLAGSLLFSLTALSAAPAEPPAPQAATNVPGVLIPSPPKPRSPVDIFRELLAMSPIERRRAVTNRPPEVQRRILAKVLEYESLKPEEREVRLRATELQWYLLPLMSAPRANRGALLALVPAELQKLVEARLAYWDLLPPPLQQQMLNNEMTARYFSQPATSRALALSKMSPERRATLEAGLDHWRGLSEEQRAKTLESFNAFFELTPNEKKTALNTLSEAEQRQMEKTLQLYEKLSEDQRLQCIRSFRKFAGMTVEERQQFLKNARTWKSMSAADREAWSKLVHIAPIMPPLPPLPPPRAECPSTTVASAE